MGAQMNVTVKWNVKDANGATIISETSLTDDYDGGDALYEVITVSNGASNQQIDLAHLASGAMRVVVASDYAITIKLASTGGEARYVPAGMAVYFAVSAAETNWYVSNASGSDATVTVVAIEAAA